MDGESARRAWVAVAVWLAFQLTLTTLPGSVLPPLPALRLDRVVHFGLYAVLGGLVARAALLSGWPARRVVAAWGVIVVVGVFDELHQRLIPGRGAELVDGFMDAAGAAVGLALGALVMRTRWGQWLG
jgi:VanZ family protein